MEIFLEPGKRGKPNSIGCGASVSSQESVVAWAIPLRAAHLLVYDKTAHLLLFLSFTNPTCKGLELFFRISEAEVVGKNS